MDKAAAEALYLPSAIRVLEQFPIQAERPRLVVMSENVTFRVTDRCDGASYVLRLHRPGYHNLAELESERVWLRALAEAGIAVPAPVSATDGQEYLPVSIPQTGETRYAGLTRWVDGEIVADVLQRRDGGPEVERYFAQLGTIMASMHNQASGWTAPPSFTRHRLDADGLVGDLPFWGRFWEHDALTTGEKRLLIDTRDRVRAVLARYGRNPATFSMIHADLHRDNLVVDDGRLTVIDFDDAGFGWHQYDIAVALSRHEAPGDPSAFERGFVDSYRATRAITDESLALVPMFRLIRDMVIIGWKHQRPEVQWPSGVFERIKDGVMAGCAAFEPPL